MLWELRIHNFGIIDDLEVTLAPGLNVLTGETGAGKSLIVDAVGAILGARAQPEWLRAGAESGFVEGIFKLEGDVAERVSAFLRQEGLDEEEGLLVLSREMRAGGRSIARVNGRTVTTGLLGEIGAMLVDIHGQGEHLSLLRPRAHLFLLDRYAHLEEMRSALAEGVTRLRQVRRELENLRTHARDLAQRADLLAYQIEEIQGAALQPGEDEELETERRRLTHAEHLIQGVEEAILALEGDVGTVAGALDLIGSVQERLDRLSEMDGTLRALAEQAEILADQVNDLLRALHDYREQVEFNPQRLEEVEERLALIWNLKRKYGDTIEEILAYAEKAEAELSAIQGADERIEELEKEETRLLRQLGEMAATLSEKRREAAERLAREVEAELQELRMKDTRFQVDFRHQEDPEGLPVGGRRLAFDATGIDRVEFLVSANPGEPLRPLARVASGGETARLMLALKTVLAHADPVPVLIFDEIDVGIGGRVGGVVGRKLWNLARTHQVLCVTHLPQLAAYGDRHFSVTKHVEGERTVVRVRILEGEERVRELAAMLGAPTEAGLRSAQEMLADVPLGVVHGD